MAAPTPATAHRPDEDALIAVDSPGIGIRIEEPADTEEMSIDGHSADGSHAWCGRVLKSPLQLQVEGGSSPVNWKSLPLRHRSPDLGSASLSSPSLSPSPSPSASSPGSYDSGYGFGLFTPPDDDRRDLEDSTRDYVQQQDFQDQLTRRGELLPLLQESPDLLSFHDSPLEQQIFRLTFSDEEVVYLSNSVVDPNSPSSDSLFPNSSSPSIPLSGSPTLYPLAFHSPEASENGRSATVLTTEFPPLGRKPVERSPSLPPSPGSLLLKPELAPNSTSNPSMDDKRVFDRPLSEHRHNSMSASSTLGPHGVHGLVTSHYHSPENRPHSPSFARRSLARHARIRSRSASPYEASSELHAHPRRSSSRSIPDLHTQPTETPSFLTQAHRTSSGSSVISRSPRAAGSSYRLRAASFDSPTGKTAPPTSHVRASYNPDDGSSEDVEMGSTHYLSPVGAGATRERSISFSSSSTSPSNPPSPSLRSSTRNHSSGQKVRGSRSFHNRSSMAIDPRDDEEGPSTDEGESSSESDYDYPGSKPSSKHSIPPPPPLLPRLLFVLPKSSS
ncbi:hypothetical protein FA13DRAFT_156853 [Coprinellus micaceus]|uniref:Uncharacterized protein n=1 Tax=Coprinellus micaceus TaxID=71717 RepID=A0A4Y7THP4_COPMI|nr:hypothetical protein FA13DRAFT_156853 [Coprinellus micaceus]